MALILILEDELSLASYWRRLLEEQGHQVICRPKVSQALEAALSNTPDLIIADMMIKDQDRYLSEGGLTLIGKRITGVLPSVPILGVSGYRRNPPTRSISPLEIAKNMGVDIALYKPISPESLLEAVHELLSKSENVKPVPE